MRRIAAWRIKDKKPTRLTGAEIDLEKDLEDWIDQDPAMIGEGYRILARQLTLASRGRLDLLAATPQGQLVVIEIKRGPVNQDTLFQALGYVTTLVSTPKQDLEARIKENCRTGDRNPPEDLHQLLDFGDADREVQAVAVGCGMDLDSKEALDYLSGRYGVPVRALSFQVFSHDGSLVLTREVAEKDKEPERALKFSIPAVLAVPENERIKSQFESLLRIIEKHPRLHAKPWATSIMCAPEQMKTRALFTFKAEQNAENLMGVWVGPEGFEEFFGISAGIVEKRLFKGARQLNEEQTKEFAAALDGLMEDFGERGCESDEE